jgi:ferric-dicitrate binding protein FerR (iron transport regulator)
MSTDRRAIEELLSPMTQADDDLAPRRVQVDRDKIIDRMVEASLAPPTLQERFGSRKLGYALALAAGFALAAFGASRLLKSDGEELDVVALGGQVTSVRGGVVTVLGVGQHAKLDADSKLETSAGARAELRAPGGVLLGLAENTQVSVAELTAASASTLRLERGEVRCTIEHQPQRVFSVVTPDARVVDVGTVFTVNVKPASKAAAASETRVSVEQGEVLVKGTRGEEHLRASQSWSSAPPAAAPAASQADQAPLDLAAEDSTDSPRSGSKPSKARPNTLAAETELLKSGLASEQRGDYRAAAQALDKLVKRYPSSPLAPDAKAAFSRVKGHLQSQK